MRVFRCVSPASITGDKPRCRPAPRSAAGALKRAVRIRRLREDHGSLAAARACRGMKQGRG